MTRKFAVLILAMALAAVVTAVAAGSTGKGKNPWKGLFSVYLTGPSTENPHGTYTAIVHVENGAKPQKMISVELFCGHGSTQWSPLKIQTTYKVEGFGGPLTARITHVSPHQKITFKVVFKNRPATSGMDYVAAFWPGYNDNLPPLNGVYGGYYIHANPS